MNMENYTLPSGGPLDLSPLVSAAVSAHLELIAAPRENADYRGLVKRRNEFVGSLDERDRVVLRIIGNALVSLGTEPAKAAMQRRRPKPSARRGASARGRSRQGAGGLSAGTS